MSWLPTSWSRIQSNPGVVVRFLADNLDGVFIAPTVRGPQAEEDRSNHIGASIFKGLVHLQRGMGNVIDDTDCEMVFGLILAPFVKTALPWPG